MPSKLFISYCHQDSGYIERLHTHLALLKREGKVSVWYDHEIVAGDNLSEEIKSELESSDVFLAMISPDYIASRYCIEVELQRALERHEQGLIRVIPIILEPCEWKLTPIVRLKAVPKDGKPISDWQNGNTAFLDVVSEIRRAVENPESIPLPKAPASPAAQPHLQPVSKGYRSKKEFDAIDRSDFRRRGFDQIKTRLRALVEEIDGIDGLKARFSDLSATSFSCSLLNPSIRRGLGAITVHSQTNGMGMGDIYYSTGENSPPNTSNGGFNISADEYELYWSPFMSFQRKDERLSANDVAEIIWKQLLDSAGVAYAS